MSQVAAEVDALALNKLAFAWLSAYGAQLGEMSGLSGDSVIIRSVPVVYQPDPALGMNER